MKRRIWLFALALALFIAGVTLRSWLGPLLRFVGANTEVIQGLEAAIQLVIEAVGAVMAIFAFVLRRKKSAIATAPPTIIVTGKHGRFVQTETYIEKQEVHKQTTDPSALRAAYLNRLFETARQLSLAGVDPKVASEAEARLNLEAVYTALLTLTPEAHEQFQRGAVAERETRRLSAVEQLNRHSRLVLLGDPGSGKSTFVNFVTLCLAGEALRRNEANIAVLKAPLPDEKDQEKHKKEPQPWDHETLLPVRIILRDFAARGLPEAGAEATANHLWRFIAAELETATLGDYAPHLRDELLKKGGLLLLDGLDEVPEAHQRRTQIKQTIEDFAATFRHCRILVTSRTYAYQKQDWRLPNFAQAVLASFSDGQIRRFVEHWYDHIGTLRGLHADDAKGRAELLKRAIFSSERLQALAQRPLLLTLMASLHAWRGGSLPDKREELYADTVDLLLDWWERPKAIRGATGQVKVEQPSLAEWLKVDRQKVRDLLNALAFQAHVEQPELVGTADVPEGKLVPGLMHLSQNPEVNPTLLVDYLSQRAGLLLPRGEGVYTFPHRTFQEYLAACYLTDHDYPEKLAELVRTDPNRWREVALLAGAKAARGSASTIWSLVEALCHRDPMAASTPEEFWGAHLAGQALVEIADLTQVSERNRSKVERVQQWLVQILKRGEFPAVERVLAGDSLARLGDARREVMTLDEMQFCFVPAGPFCMGSSDKDEMAFGDEKPLEHEMPLEYDFWISRFPISNAQFEEFVRDGGYWKEPRYWVEAEAAGVWENGEVKGWNDEHPRAKPHDFGVLFNLPNHPVVGVTWYEMLAFTRWLTEVWREKGWIVEKAMVHLPSEAEWEKAARGGMKIPLEREPRSISNGLKEMTLLLQNNDLPQRRYPWRNDPDPNRANYDATGIGTTSAVGCFASGTSPYGCEEMSGNVWEWTRSLWGEYPYPQDEKKRNERENLTAPKDEHRVLRGGAFGYDVRFVRCACRGRSGPNLRYRDVGFRIVVLPFTLVSEVSAL